jgi:hypothetical protein
MAQLFYLISPCGSKEELTRVHDTMPFMNGTTAFAYGYSSTSINSPFYLINH